MDERKALTSQFCPQYNTQVEFLMETSVEPGRTLIARYEIGGPDDHGRRQAGVSGGDTGRLVRGLSAALPGFKPVAILGASSTGSRKPEPFQLQRKIETSHLAACRT
jgi:hypothetical protein